MNGFDIFQTATATMKKITTDYAGDETVANSFSVEIDPVFGWNVSHLEDGTETEGRTTTVSTNSNIDISHDKWELDYNGRNYQIKTIDPIYDIGTDNISHFEVELR